MVKRGDDSMKAMILAAGLGTRMRPLTHTLPKPMIPIFGTPLIRFPLELLKRICVKHALVNLHHLPHALQEYLNGLKDFDFTYSQEPKILGTGGGILKAKKFLLKDGTFIVMNSDVIINVNLEDVLKFHRQKKSLATMVVRRMPIHETYESVGIDRNGKIIVFKAKKVDRPLIRTMFTGIHIFEPEIFKYFPKNKKIFCINNDVYAKLVQKKMPVYGFLHAGFWYDIGTLDLYSKYLASAQFRTKLLKFFPGIILPKRTG